jgi:hypothetical protein
MGLNNTLSRILSRRTQDSSRLSPLADYIKLQLAKQGLSGIRGGSDGELQIAGYARPKDWDVAYDFAGKPRLLISLKSIWKNASGTVPNRLDDLMGEAANVQQMSPEVVTGYVMLFDVQADSLRRDDGLTWSAFMETRLERLCVRKAPMWNQGLIEACWFIRFDSRRARADMLVEADKTREAGAAFFGKMISELMLREPAIPRSSTSGGFTL